MSLSKPSISVVITCYSEGKLILDAIKSIENQSITASEIILVNDASTHVETIATCQQLEKNPHIKVIWRDKNGGPSAARNEGFRVASGEILVPLDADDILPPNSLELIQQAFSATPDTGFVYGQYVRQNQPDSDGELIEPDAPVLRQMLRSKGFSLSSQWRLLGTTPLRRSLWESVGGYDVSFGVDDLHDVEFWMRAIATGCSYQYIAKPIYHWRKYLGSNSRRVTPLAWYRVAEKHLDLYRQIGLEYRAYELLLLGSKWLNDAHKTRYYSRELIRCIHQGNFQLSTLLVLGIPAQVLQFMATQLGKKR